MSTNPALGEPHCSLALSLSLKKKKKCNGGPGGLEDLAEATLLPVGSAGVCGDVILVLGIHYLSGDVIKILYSTSQLH